MSARTTDYSLQDAKEKSIGRHVPWVSHIGPSTIITRDGALIRVYHLEGVSQESVSDADVDHWKETHNTLLLSIQNPRCAIWTHLIRRPTSPVLKDGCITEFADELDTQYRETLDAADIYENSLYLAVIIAPPLMPAQSLIRTIKGLTEKISPHHAETLKALEDVHLSLTEAFSHYSPVTLTLYEESGITYSEPLSFAAEIASGTRVKIPLDHREGSEAISVSELAFGPEAYRLTHGGQHHYGGILSVVQYNQDTAPTELNNLLALPMPFVLTQSFHFLEKTAATQMVELQINKMNNAGDHGQNQIDAMDIALDQLVSNELCLGGHHMTLSTTGANIASLDKQIAVAQAALSSGARLIAKRERLGAEAAYWAQIPGNSSYITRNASITSRNFAGLNVFHRDSSGRETGNHWGDAVTLLRTKNQTPYWFNFHHPKDVGNTILIGPTGEGKTVLALFLLAQLEKLDVTRIYFDKDRGAEVGIRAMGGAYSTLRKGEPTGYNPCCCEDTRRNREFLRTWAGMLAGGHLTTSDHEAVDEAIDGLFRLPLKERRLSELNSFIQQSGQDGLNARLKEWTGTERLGWVFDNDQDDLSLDASIQGFDVTDFLEDMEVRTPILAYIFHRMDEILDGRRVCIAFDEGWRLLDDQEFSGFFRAQLKTIRKKNGMTFFATQEPHDILDTAMSKTILSQSPTKIFLRNHEAKADDYCEGFGLTEQELNQIQKLPPRHFLIKQGQMAAVIDFNLRGLDDHIAVLSGTAATNKLLDTLLEEVGPSPEHWLPLFHERRKS